MQRSLNKFATAESAVSSYIYHKLLGLDFDDLMLNSRMPKHFTPPNIPELNISQVITQLSILEFLFRCINNIFANVNHR